MAVELTSTDLQRLMLVAKQGNLLSSERRSLLFAFLGNIMHELPEKAIPADQLRSDVQLLAGMPTDPDKPHALSRWLDNAARLAPAFRGDLSAVHRRLFDNALATGVGRLIETVVDTTDEVGAGEVEHYEAVLHVGDRLYFSIESDAPVDLRLEYSEFETESDESYDDEDESEESYDDQEESYDDEDESEESYDDEDESEESYDDEDESEESHDDEDESELSYDNEDEDEDELFAKSRCLRHQFEHQAQQPGFYTVTVSAAYDRDAIVDVKLTQRRN